MNIILFWKLLTELSLYFCFAHFVGALAGGSGSLLRNVLLLTLTGTVGTMISRRRPKLRMLALVLLVPVFYLTENLIDKLLLIIPAAYVALMLWRRVGDTDYYEYQRQYKMGIKIMCVIGVLLLMAWQHPAIADYVLPYVLCYLVGGVLALRLLRHSDNMQSSRQLWIHNFISLVPIAVAGLLISSKTAGRAALATIKFLFNVLVYPVIALFSWIMTWITYFLFSLVSKIDIGEGQGPMQELQDFAQENTERIMEQGELNTIPTEVLIGILLVIIFAALAWMMLRFLRQNSTQRQNNIHEVRSRIDDVVSVPRESLFDRSPRSRVRATYRKFISLCIGAGAQVRRTDTTEDIDRLARYALLTPPGTGELKDIYRRARYSAQEITDADAENAKAAYQAAKSHYKKASKV